MLLTVLNELVGYVTSMTVHNKKAIVRIMRKASASMWFEV
jgi:hypothetical protein